MTTFLQKTFLLGAVVASAVSASDCSNMGGFRVGIGLGVANGVSTQKMSTTGVDGVPTFTPGYTNTQANPLVVDSSVTANSMGVGGHGATLGWLNVPNGTYNQGVFNDSTGIGGFFAGTPGNSGLIQEVEVTPNTTSSAASRKANLGKVGLAGVLNLEYCMYVGGSALVGFGVDVHNGTGYMTSSKDSGSNLSSSLISTKLKTVWGVTPKLMFGWQLAPRTMLTFSVGASIDKYKTQNSFNTIPVVISGVESDATATGAQEVITYNQNSRTFTLPNTFSAPKFNKTKVGIQLGLGMRTIVAPNVELMIEGKATFGKAIKLNYDFTEAAKNILPSYDGEGTSEQMITNSSYNIKTMTQKFTMQKYELLVGVAYKFGGSDKASAAA